MKFNKNNINKGFTLIEMVVALGLIVLFSGFTIVTLSVIPQMRIRKEARTLKSEFILTRDFAKTHGGDAELIIRKHANGVDIIRSGENITTETHNFSDSTEVFYGITGVLDVFHLGFDDYEGDNEDSKVKDGTLKIRFSQTDGRILGPHMLDYIILSNGNKAYKLMIYQESGSIFFDYELPDGNLAGNKKNENMVTVEMPTLLMDGKPVDTPTLTYTGNPIQPDIAYDSRNIKISGVYRAVEPKTYAIVFKLKDPYHTAWERPIDGSYSADYVLYWKIE